MILLCAGNNVVSVNDSDEIIMMQCGEALCKRNRGMDDDRNEREHKTEGAGVHHDARTVDVGPKRNSRFSGS